MTHPAIQDAEVEKLRRQTSGTPTPSEAASSSAPYEPSPKPIDRARAVVRRAATPVVQRVRAGLDDQRQGEIDALRAEVAELRRELERTRTELAAAIAALRERDTEAL